MGERGRTRRPAPYLRRWERQVQWPARPALERHRDNAMMRFLPLCSIILILAPADIRLRFPAGVVREIKAAKAGTVVTVKEE